VRGAEDRSGLSEKSLIEILYLACKCLWIASG
jgi:hypothetical protein